MKQREEREDNASSIKAIKWKREKVLSQGHQILKIPKNKYKFDALAAV